MAHRSELFILSYQIDGLCASLRQTVPYGLPVGPLTIALTKRFKNTFDRVTNGPPVEGLSDVDETTSPVDVRAVAEILR